MRIHVNKKKYNANTSKQERVLKRIPIRKAGRNMCKQERVSKKILVSKKSVKGNIWKQ